MFKKSKRKADNELANTQKQSLIKIVISLVVAVLVWIGATSFESYLLSDKNTTEVIVANKNIEDGTVISKDNVEEYFTEMIVNSSLVTKSTIKDMKDIKGKACIKIEQGEIITSNMFYDATYVNEKFNDPVEVTFSAKNVENSVVGTLREGDLVDIIVSTTDPTTNVTISEVLYSNVYIIATYDENYVKVEDENKDSQAVYFKIYLERDQEAEFATLLSNGNFTIAKVK